MSKSFVINYDNISTNSSHSKDKKRNSIEEKTISDIKKKIMSDQRIFINLLELDHTNVKKYNDILAQCWENKDILPKKLICFEIDKSGKKIKEIENKELYFSLFESHKIKHTALSLDQFSVILLNISNETYIQFSQLIRHLRSLKFHVIMLEENITFTLKKDSFYDPRTKIYKHKIYSLFIDFFQSKIHK
jgi:hypothetical protein